MKELLYPTPQCLQVVNYCEVVPHKLNRDQQIFGKCFYSCSEIYIYLNIHFKINIMTPLSYQMNVHIGSHTNE